MFLFLLSKDDGGDLLGYVFVAGKEGSFLVYLQFFVTQPSQSDGVVLFPQPHYKNMFLFSTNVGNGLGWES